MTRHVLIIGAALSALVLTGCNRKAADADRVATPAEQAATPDANPAATIPTPANEAAAPDFVTKTSISDMFEIQAGELAQKRSTTKAVKDFAAMMVKDHTKSSADLKAAIGQAGQPLTPLTALPGDKQGTLTDLANTDPAGFDKKYMEGQVDAHQDALNVLQRYAQDGDVAALRTFAAATAPVVQQHLDKARQVRDALK